MQSTLLDQLQEKIKTYLSEIREKNQSIENLTNDIAGYKKEVSRCKNQNRKLQTDIKDLLAQVEKLTANKVKTKV